jgi:hypothetical protein
LQQICHPDWVAGDPAWFWTERWQQREREVDEHVTAGRVQLHDSTEKFLVHLDPTVRPYG